MQATLAESARPCIQDATVESSCLGSLHALKRDQHVEVAGALFAQRERPIFGRVVLSVERSRACHDDGPRSPIGRWHEIRAQRQRLDRIDVENRRRTLSPEYRG